MSTKKIILYDLPEVKKRLSDLIYTKFINKKEFAGNFADSRSSIYRWLDTNDKCEVNTNMFYIINSIWPDYDLTQLITNTNKLPFKSQAAQKSNKSILNIQEFTINNNKDREISKLKDQLISCKDKVIELQEEISKLKSNNVAHM